jgi:Uma2 family endonuclease
MSTVSVARMTAEEFFEWANRPENEGGRYELERGGVIEMPSPGERHGIVCWLVGLILGQYLFRRGAGSITTNDSGLIVERNPDTVRGPDVTVVLDRRTYADVSPKYTDRTPALVVEVMSPSDKMVKAVRRAGEYLLSGIQMVWIIDPEDQVVYVHRLHELTKALDETDELTGNGVLPDFACKVADLFTLPGQQPPPAPQQP